MKSTAKVIKGDPAAALQRLEELAKRLSGPDSVKVGLPKGSNNYPDGTSVIMVGTVHEFGATVKHPGGTSFGFMSESDAKSGNVKFLPKGGGFMELGVTKAHTIKIPERSFLRSTMNTEKRAYKSFLRELSKKIVSGKLTKEKALKTLGLKVQTDVRERITDIKSPALKSRTGNPLVDTGHLRQSIIYKVGD